MALTQQQTLFPRDGATIIAVLNLTPDSFSDGGRFVGSDDAPRVDAVIAVAESMVEAGADLIDVGGESTRPGAEEVSPAREIRRTASVIEALVKRTDVPISIVTRKAVVAKAAIESGARIVNDISGLTYDSELAQVANQADGLILGHLRGAPRSMQHNIRFKNVIEDVADELEFSVRQATSCGISRSRLCVDPGIGFGKEFEQNLKLIANLGILRERLDLPLLVGVSRKSFLGTITGDSVNDREIASHAACAIAVFQGADVVRVHDVAGTRRVVQVAMALRQARGSA